MKSQDSKGNCSMSNLSTAGAAGTKYMGGSSAAQPTSQKGAAKTIIADHDKHTSGYASASYMASSTKNKRR